VYKKQDKKRLQRLERVETPKYILDDKKYPSTSVKVLKQKKEAKTPAFQKPLRFNLQPDTELPSTPRYAEAYTPPLGNTQGLPFQFSRTLSKNLPVYHRYKKSQPQRVFTVVRKYYGDHKELTEELSRLLPGVTIKERAGSLELDGDHAKTVKNWLVRLGF
jgi:translation initiation factor 1 (eIF-1/SUI1)